MNTSPQQTQLSLHQPEDRGEYEVDVSAEFNQDIAQEPISIQPASAGDEWSARIESATPAMKQYYKAKAEHPDCLLFYRMGDFYEMFCEDALEAAAVLDIALTKRGKQAGEDIPMCGVPVHAYEQYAEKLIRAGKRVAVCEQMESPEEAKKRGYKSIVHREVVRILTPGTLTEEALLEAGASNYLASLAKLANDTKTDEPYAVAWLDCSTGEVLTTACTLSELPATLSRINPKELVFSDQLQQSTSSRPIIAEYSDISVAKPDHLFELGRATRRVQESYGLVNLAPLEGMGQAELSALGALLEYVAITQKNQMPRLDMPRRIINKQVMQLDQSTQRNLELVVRQNGEKKLSLLHVIDDTKTASGSRLLATWLVAPLTDVDAICARQDAVECFLSATKLRDNCRDTLATAADSERALSRLVMDRANPRDLLAVKHGLMAARDMNGLFEQAKLATVPRCIDRCWQQLRGHEDLVDRLHVAIKPDAVGLLRDGNFIQPGFNAALDEYRRLKENGRQAVAELQQSYQKKTGISTLKIKFNQVLGYFVEITPTHQSKITEVFIHRQTLANALRYTTTELSELEQNISQAASRALKLELEIFETLKAEILNRQQPIITAARALAELDVLAALAHLADTHRYCRPEVDDSSAFHIKGGRHPVVEKSLGRQGDQFAPNDCDMNEASRLWLLTGPNMAGKSTYLRQNALIAILAQMGSFVPAESAHIGVIDKLFSRVGAADDLARGQSTFMVEMSETAAILNQATARSFVILDEIGRGTATYDGLSIAWAVVEHMYYHIQSRTLFATHYHELTELEGDLEHMACYHMRVKEYQGQLVFMHQVAEGNSEGSYGVHVAKLAGLPPAVIQRAADLLVGFDQSKPVATARPMAMPIDAPLAAKHPAMERLQASDPNVMTPRDALDLLFELKKLF